MTDENNNSAGPVSSETPAKEKQKKRGFFSWGRKKQAADEPQQPDPTPTEKKLDEQLVNAETAPISDRIEPEQNTTEQAQPVDDLEPQSEPVATSPDEVLHQPHAPEPKDEPVKAKKMGFFQRLKQGLTKSSNKLSEGVTGIFTKKKLDDETLEELEDLLITSDLGVTTASKISTRLAAGRYNKEISTEEVKAVLADEIVKVLQPIEHPFETKPNKKPHIVLMVGVNGTGKTTTIGKMAAKAKDQGLKTMMAAGDTFRAAAIEQLKVWGERTNSPVIAKEVGADAASLAYDAIEQARKEKADILFIDTAGRLQNKANLMAELEKVIRVIKKLDPEAPHNVLLVLDATTGQNAVTQAEAFRDIAGVTGLIMTKLDGTARGGILIAIAEKFGLPVHAIGVGESIEDLQTFNARAFADALVGRDQPDPGSFDEGFSTNAA